MDNTALDLFRKILKELGEIKRIVHDAIPLPSQQKRSTDRDQQNSQKSDDEHRITTPLISEPNPSKTGNKDTRSKENHTKTDKCLLALNKYKPLIETVGIVTLAVYTTVTILQWFAITEANRISNDSLKSSRLTFIKDQRPFVLLGNVQPEIFAAQKIMSWKIEKVNYGRSPAVNVIGRQEVFYGKDALLEADQFFQNLPKIIQEGARTILTPNATGIPAFSSVPSKLPLTEEDIQFIRSHDFAVAIVGRLQYEDLSGNVYFTDFCRTTAVSGALAHCAKHNEIR